MADEASFIFSDSALSRRLEKTEALGNVEFVEARARAFPDSGARWIKVAGAYAMYDGVASPLTQTFGLGLFDPVSHADMERVEQFFRERDAPILHEVSPLAENAFLTLLNERGYQPIELTTVMFRPIGRGDAFATRLNERIRVRKIGTNEQELWARTAVEGWGESPELKDFIMGLAQVGAQRSDALSFIAESDGQPIATGALSICEGVALLAGASTVPEGRKQGAQLALLDSRLRYAVEQGCDIAMMCAQPGSASQRNAERQGFRIAYTRIKWQSVRPAA